MFDEGVGEFSLPPADGERRTRAASLNAAAGETLAYAVNILIEQKQLQRASWLHTFIWLKYKGVYLEDTIMKYLDSAAGAF